MTSGSIRLWLLAGLFGVLLVVSLSPLWDAWVVNRAGVTVNRVLAARPASPNPEGAAAAATGREIVLADTSFALDTPGAPALLEDAMEMLAAAALRGPHGPSREIPIWRTYGAAARLIPSAHAYELLLRSRNAGRVDRIGELWLGEVAAALGELEEATRAYRRVDASNLLIYRGEVALRAGDKELALTHFSLAYQSLAAATERSIAEQLLLDRTGQEPSLRSRLSQRPAERVTSLYRLGRGVLNAEEPQQAVVILEEALVAAKAHSPGALVEQGLHLSLALALARTLPAPSYPLVSGSPTYFSIDDDELAHLAVLARIRRLVFEATRSDLTAPTCVQAGRVLLLTGDDATAVGFLEQALKLDPLLPEAYLMFGARYEDLGMFSSARELYSQGLEMLPTNADLAGALAVATYKTMLPEVALPLLEKAAEMAGGRDPMLFVALGDCYLDMGLPAQATAAYRVGLTRFPGTHLLAVRLASVPPRSNVLP